MTFVTLQHSSELCHICGIGIAQYSNDSGILFCESCHQEAQEIGRKTAKFKRGVSINVRLDAQDIQKLKAVASESGRSFNHLINIAIKSFIKRLG